MLENETRTVEAKLLNAAVEMPRVALLLATLTINFANQEGLDTRLSDWQQWQ